MMERLPTLPVNARLLAGQLEDEMSTWRERRMGELHPAVREAALKALDRASDLISELELFKVSLAQELDEYERAAKKGQT